MKDVKRYHLMILYLLLCMVVKGQTEAQQIVPQSPTVGSLIQYADCPVSYYSGTPNINLPLYEINVDNFKIPISLSYNASGIKVAQESSWVGLGWSLNAGGCISRSVQCYDDFLERSYPGINVEKGYYDDKDITNPASPEYYNYIYTSEGLKLQLVKDTEPDIFYYSFLGYSGKFILDKSRGPVLFDKSSGIQITVTKDSSQKKTFMITAPDGTMYIFNVKERAYLHSRSGFLHSNNSNPVRWDEAESSFPGSPVEYVSSWLLTKIMTPNKREISFSYKAELYKSPAQESCVKYTFLGYSGNNASCGKNTTYPYYSTSKGVYETYSLTRISWDNGYIVFNLSDREDTRRTIDSPQKLQNIRVYNKLGLIVKGYDFEYDYFNGNKTGDYDYVFKRLRLESVTDYYDANNRYVFNYFEGTLPAKNSKNTDYWGYYNGQSYGGNYYSEAFNGGVYYAGAKKKSSLFYLKMGTLQSIQYPTGGIETFTYQENTFTGSATISGHIKQNSYGFEVYSKDIFDDYPHIPADTSFTFTLPKTTVIAIKGYMEVNGSNRNENYDYEDDILRIHPLNSSRKLYAHTSSEVYGKDYMAIDQKITLEAGTYVFDIFPPPPDTYAYWSLNYDDITFPSSSTECKGGGLRIAQINGGGNERLFTYSGGCILVDPAVSYFERLTCTNSGSLTGHFYYLVQTSESTIPLSSFRNGNYVGYSVVKETINTKEGPSNIIYSYYNQQEELIDEHPYTLADINFKNGLLRYIEYCQGNTVVKEDVFEYESIYSPQIKAFKFVPGDMTRHSYDYQVEWNSKSLQRTINKGSKYPSIKEEEYIYNDQLFPKSKKSYLYDKWFEEKTCYPTDYTDAISKKMVANNYVGIPVEQFSLVDGKVIAGNKLSFKDTLNMYLPAIRYVLNAKSPLPEASYNSAYKAEVYYDIYNKYGKLLQKREKGTPVVYLWSYKGEYPVAEIRNATYESVALKLSLQNITVEALCDKEDLTIAQISVLNTLRKVLPEALVTIYTYKPQVGVASITDSHGVTTYYEYDDAGRLQECFYKEGIEKRVLERYNYHYTNTNK